ncbi:MAG: NTF2-like N-terminal transpeptidase domain-containing protein, partial [Chloroflexota bacterium]
MKVFRLLFFSFLFLLMGACSSQSSGQTPVAAATIVITPTLPDPQVFVTLSPDPESIVNKFLAGWKKDDYPAIYPLITKKNQADISLEDFSKRYMDAMDSLTLTELNYSITPGSVTASTAEINFHVDFKTLLAGDIQRDYQVNLILENGYWRIVWNDGLVLPDLKGGNQLKMDFLAPSRGEIFDSENKPIVTQTEVMALGIIPNQVDYNTEHAMLDELFKLTDIYPGTIKALYDNKRNTDWYLAIGEAALSDINRLAGFGGVVMAQYNSRFYYHGGIAPQSVGYVAPLPREQLGSFLRRGYAFNQRTGQTGIEKWAEQYLAGKTGGKLYLVDKSGKVIVPAKYIAGSDFFDGLALVLEGRKRGFINGKGEVQIPFEYDDAS